ncbi:MAG TPA: NAD-dependent epimerase/dehydratase family protein, partial [Candidatus Dormibacteraeota bacterium]|nr:NAD-dependent epimerase/dehydratase family protein [Candidatus Dormibacteraeota bacterium]
MRVAVTGGSGFIGGALIRALDARGDDVVALARSDEAAQKVTAAGASAIRGGLASVAALRKTCRGADLVIHCAAKLSGAPRDADEFRKVNVAGTRHVIEAARTTNVPRLVHLSTEQVLLGPRPIVDADESVPYPRRVIGLYAQTKQEAERLVRDANSAELETVCVRPRFV